MKDCDRAEKPEIKVSLPLHSLSQLQQYFSVILDILYNELLSVISDSCTVVIRAPEQMTNGHKANICDLNQTTDMYLFFNCT